MLNDSWLIVDLFVVSVFIRCWLRWWFVFVWSGWMVWLGGLCVGWLGVCCAWFVCVVSLTWCFVVTNNASVVGLRLVVCVALELVFLIWVLILLNLRFGV